MSSYFRIIKVCNEIEIVVFFNIFGINVVI